MSVEPRAPLLPVVSLSLAPGSTPRDTGWMRAAHQAKWLAVASLVWMTLEGGLGVVAGLQANSISVLTWAASSAVEGLASAIVIWRLTGRRQLSQTSERRAQKWVAASFFLLAPYFIYEAVNRLLNGGHTEATVLAVALTASSVVLMPLLGWAKLRLGRRLDSSATAGEGMQNLLCAGQALAAGVAVLGAGAGLDFLDPLATFLIAAVALKEGVEMWRGDDCACHSVPGLDAPTDASCSDGQGEHGVGHDGDGDDAARRSGRVCGRERRGGSVRRRRRRRARRRG